MASSSTFFLNGPSLASATAVFLDSNLTVCAPDEFYSDGLIARQQVNCILLPQQNCPSCPGLFPSFLGSLQFSNANISCNTNINQTYYFEKVHVEPDSFVGLNDNVFIDSSGTSPLANGFYLINNVAAPNKVIEVENGIVVAITECLEVSCLEYFAEAVGNSGTVSYIDCSGNPVTFSLNTSETLGFCAEQDTVSFTGSIIIGLIGNCLT